MNLTSLLDKLNAEHEQAPLRVRPSATKRKDDNDDDDSSGEANGNLGRPLNVFEDGNTVFGAGRSEASEASDSGSASASSLASTAAKRTRKRMRPPPGLLPPAPAPAPAAAGQHQPPQPPPGLARQPARTLDNEDNSDGLADEIQWSKTRPEPDWVTTPEAQIFRRLVNGEPQPPERCVGCCYERGDSFAIHYDHWRQLNAMITGKFRRMDRLQMAREIKKFFDKHIFGPTQPPNPIPEGCVPVPPWDLATILEHYEHHDSHPAMRRIKRGEQLSKLIDRFYEENMCYNPRSRSGRFMVDSNGNRRIRVHGDSLRNYLALCAAEERLDKLQGRDQIGGAEEDIRPFVQLEGRKFVLDNVAGFDCTAPDAQMGGAAQGSTVSGQGRKKRAFG